MKRPSVAETIDQLCYILLHLQIAAHLYGYKQLRVAIPRFAQDTSQSLSKDLYPYVAQALDCVSWQSVEHAIRDAIAYGWEKGDREVWNMYFPGCREMPSNKRFIATLAEYIKE